MASTKTYTIDSIIIIIKLSLKINSPIEKINGI